MRKTFVALLIAAVGVWGYVVAQVIAAFFGRPSGGADKAGAHRVAMVAVARARPPLDTSYRDPFQPYLYAQKPAPVRVAQAVKPAPRPVVIEPPKAVLGGVLGGDPPVAILKQDGRTELVKEGAEVWDLKVIRIERHQVTVEKQGRRFTLAY